MSLYENRGRTFQVLMDMEKAADDFQKEIDLAKELGKKNIEAQALLNLALCYRPWGALTDLNKVRKCLDKSRKLVRETGDQAGEIRWNIMAGIQTLISLGQDSESATYLQEAIDACKKTGNKRGLGPALGFLGLCHIRMGDLNKGIKEASESREIAREIGNQFLLVSSFHWSLLGHGSRGDYDKAFKALENLAKGANEIGSKGLIAMVPNHYGWLYSELCNFEKAVIHDKKGLDVSQRLEDPEAELYNLLNLVGEHIGFGDYDTAQHYLNEVQEKRELQRYTDRCPKSELHFFRYMSELSRLKENYSKAMEFAEETLARGQSMPSKKYISMGWKLKGDVLMILEKIGEAAECFEKGRDVSDQMGYPPLMWKTRFSLAQIYNQQSNYDAAKKSLAEASSIIERMASKVSDTEVKETFLNSEPIQNVNKQLNAL